MPYRYTQLHEHITTYRNPKSNTNVWSNYPEHRLGENLTNRTSKYDKHIHTLQSSRPHLHTRCIFWTFLVRVTKFITLAASLHPWTCLGLIHIIPNSPSSFICLPRTFAWDLDHFTCKHNNNVVAIKLMIPCLQYLILHKIA